AHSSCRGPASEWFSRRHSPAPEGAAQARRGEPGAGAAASALRVDDEALGERHLPLLAAQPALGLVEQPLDLPALARDACDREARALPDVVVVDLGDRGADTVLELRLRRAHEVPLLLQRVRRREVQLARQYADES